MTLKADLNRRATEYLRKHIINAGDVLEVMEGMSLTFKIGQQFVTINKIPGTEGVRVVVGEERKDRSSLEYMNEKTWRLQTSECEIASNPCGVSLLAYRESV